MRRCLDYQRLRPVDVAVLVGTAFGALVIGVVVDRALAPVGIPASGWAYGLGSVIVWMGLWALVYDRRYTRLFREELRALGHDVCMGCGYFLADVKASDPCPECGALRGGTS
jgi:hypothetical protein